MQESNIQLQPRPQRQEKGASENRLNLPVPPTALIGRERELAFAQQILADPRSRLLTLTGPGGVGKTRLSLEIAHAMADSFSDGVAFVSLAPVNDPTLVVASIAAALGLREDSSSSLIERLKNALRDRHRLLVLDNFEQVIAAAPLVVELLSAAPQVRVIVSSRAPLRVRGERELPLAPLGLPGSQPGSQQDEAIADSMSLFVQAASAVDPNFELNEENQATIAEICIRLDGLPLAIELAAARVRLLSPAKILSRLGNALELLTAGARDLPARQQTLRNAIAWSYDLLEESERTVFRRLAAFTGGCALEAAEEVCRLEEKSSDEMLETLGSLVEKSMLRREQDADGDARLMLLETIREFARAELSASGEEEAIRARHAAFFAALATEGARHLAGPEQSEWLRRLERDHDNLRSALRWQFDHGDPAAAMEMTMSLSMFWRIRSHLTEGWRWIEEALQAAPSTPQSNHHALLTQLGNILGDLGHLDLAEERYRQGLELCVRNGNRYGIASLNNNLGNISLARGNVEEARAFYERSLEIRREMNDRPGTAGALNNLGNAVHVMGDYDRAKELYLESLSLARQMGDKRRELFLLINIGVVEQTLGEAARARELFEEGVRLSRDLGDRRALGNALNHLGAILTELGSVGEARHLHEEALEIHHNLGDRNGTVFALLNLGYVEQASDAPRAAYRYFMEALEMFMAIGDRLGAVSALEGAATMMAPAGEAARAAELMAAASMIREATGAKFAAEAKIRYDAGLEQIRRWLSPPDFQAAWARGRTLDLDAAASSARAIDPAILDAPAAGPAEPLPSPAPVSPAGLPADITPRELDVLRLLASELTDAEIAGKLHISIRTVNAHLRSIYGKLGVSSRKEAARRGSAMGLIG